MEITFAAPRDLQMIMALERECFAHPWSEAGILYELELPDSGVLAAREGTEIIGVAILRTLGDEGELYNIAVRESARRRGIGLDLLRRALQWAAGRGVRRVYLEVRRSNAAARALYRAAGFTVCGERKNYYDDPREDAVLMEAEV